LASFRNEGVRPAGGIRHAAAQKGKLLLEVCHFALCSPFLFRFFFAYYSTMINK
jgi:hypothetical protein